MAKVLKADMTVNGIQGLIDDLTRYRDDLDRKVNLLVKRLAESGYHNVGRRVSSILPFYRVNSEDGSDVDVSVDFEDGTDLVTATITMSGGNAIIIEFGSGVTFNAPIGASKHPKGVETGYTIGSYPNQKNADNPFGWFFYDQYGEKQHTYGTPTFAPLWKTYLDMADEVKTLAKEIFNG